MNKSEWFLKKDKRKNRPNRAWIWNETYGQGCYILWPVTSKQFKTEYIHANPKSEFTKDEDFYISCARFISSGGKLCIGFKEARPAPGTIAHECLHFANDLFESVGIDLSHTNDEAQAYFMQWAVGKIWALTRGLK